MVGSVFWSAWIKFCAEWIVTSVEDIFGMLNFGGGGYCVWDFFHLLFWGCMPYVICSVSWMVQWTIWLLHVVSMMLYSSEYWGVLLLSLAGLGVCGCSWIIQICVCRLIGGDEFLITWADLDLLLSIVVICRPRGSISTVRIPQYWSGWRCGQYTRCVKKIRGMTEGGGVVSPGGGKRCQWNRWGLL